MKEIEIKKSKFVSYYFSVKTKQEIEEILQKLKIEHKKATHICYAYVIDGFMKSFDDDEPNGTAGKPILNVLLKQKLNNSLIVVVRYFGGIKLGAGGLIRAYTKSASEIVKNKKD